jgi:hypothetical protein
MSTSSVLPSLVCSSISAFTSAFLTSKSNARIASCQEEEEEEDDDEGDDEEEEEEEDDGGEEI